MAANLRCAARLALAGLLYYSGLLALWSALRRRLWARDEVCVLGLHRVLTAEQAARAHSLPGIVLSEASFAALLEFLTRRFDLLTLEQFQAGKLSNGTGRPACLLTFDDGWGDTYTTAFPWLKKFEAPAAVFLATGFVGSERTFWVEELLTAWSDPSCRDAIRAGLETRLRRRAGSIEDWVEQLKRMPAAQREPLLDAVLGARRAANGDRMMRWEEAAEMSREGITFGAHTVTHPLLTFEPEPEVEREAVESRRALEERLGRPVRSFAYPNGDWNDRVRRTVQQAGYELAFTTQSGWHRPGQDRLSVRRIVLHEGNVAGWSGKFSPAALSFTLARHR